MLRASTGRACTRSRCSRLSAPTRPVAAPVAGTCGTRCARSSTHSTPPSTRHSRTSSRRARGFKKRGRRLYAGYAEGLTPIAISPRQRLDDAVKTVSDLPFGGTDCALPMLYAQAREREIDTFVIQTDSETWAGDVAPAQALQDYRRASGIDARLVVVGLVSNGFSIADPNDPGQLDVVGFDTATPQLISDFARGAL